MKQPRAWATAEDWRNPVKEPRRINRKPGKQRENEKDRNRPVQETRVNRMAQQLATMNARSAYPSELASSLFIEVFLRSSSRRLLSAGFDFFRGPVSRLQAASGCGSFGP